MNRINDISDADLNRLVQSYFDCSLTVAEERNLAQVLAGLPENRLTGDRRDALAELALAAAARHAEIGKNPAPGRFSSRKRMVWTVAAAAVVVAMIGIPQILKHGEIESECYAYVDGRLVTDKEDIARMMTLQIEDMAEAEEKAQSSIDAELQEMSAAIEIFHNELPLNL